MQPTANIVTWDNNKIVEENFSMQVDGPLRKRDGPKSTWMEVVRIDMKKCNLS